MRTVPHQDLQCRLTAAVTAGVGRRAVLVVVMLLTACSQNMIREERNLGPRPLSERAGDLKSAPDPTPAEYVGRGDAAYAVGNWDKAIVEYVNSLVGAADRPENLDTLVKIASAHLEAGHHETAETTFRQVLLVRPRDVAAREGLGLALLNRQLPEQATTELKAVIAADSARWRAYNGLGIVNDVNGRMDAAKPYYYKALELVPNSSEVLNNLGYSYYLSGDFRGSSFLFRRAIDADRGNGKAWSNLGLVLARERRYQESLEAFSQLMDRPRALNSVGYVCMIGNDDACAEEYFTRAISASPTWYVEANQNLQTLRARRVNGRR